MSDRIVSLLMPPVSENLPVDCIAKADDVSIGIVLCDDFVDVPSGDVEDFKRYVISSDNFFASLDPLLLSRVFPLVAWLWKQYKHPPRRVLESPSLRALVSSLIPWLDHPDQSCPSEFGVLSIRLKHPMKIPFSRFHKVGQIHFHQNIHRDSLSRLPQ